MTIRHTVVSRILLSLTVPVIGLTMLTSLASAAKQVSAPARPSVQTTIEPGVSAKVQHKDAHGHKHKKLHIHSQGNSVTTD